MRQSDLYVTGSPVSARKASLETRFAELYGAHASSAIKFAYAISGDASVAEDLVQEAFVRIFGRFRDRGNPDSFNRYLRTTILNLWRRQLRRRVLERSTNAQQAAATVDADASSVDVIADLWFAVKQLPLRQRAAVYLRYFEDAPVRHISEVLGCSDSAVKSLLNRALTRLRIDVEEVSR